MRPEHLPGSVVRALIVVSAALTAHGDTTRALDLSARMRRILDSLEDYYRYSQRVLHLCAAAEAAAAIADLSATLTFIDEAESAIAETGTEITSVVEVAILAKTADTVGAPDRATALRDRVEATILSADDAHRQPAVAIKFAEAAAIAGNQSHAVALINRATDPSALHDRFDLGPGLESEKAATIAGLESKAAKVAALAGDLGGARALAERSAAGARAVIEAGRVPLLASLAEAAAAVGDHRAADLLDRAEDALAQQPPEVVNKDMWTLAQIGRTAAILGDIDRAHEFVRQILAFEPDLSIFEPAIEIAAAAGDLNWAARLVTQFEEHIPTARDRIRVAGLASLANAAITCGFLTQAEAFADDLEALVPEVYAESRCEALACASLVRAKTGELGRAMALLDRAEQLAQSDDGVEHHDLALIMVARAAGAVDVDRVDRVVDAMVNPQSQAEALVQTVKYRSSDRRAEAIARALRLSDWHIPVRPLVEEVPGALTAIIEELEFVQRRAPAGIRHG